jgi:hypothetical protein
MKIHTHMGFMDIDPAKVISIRTAFAIPGKENFKDLTYSVDFIDEASIAGHHVVGISEADAVKLSELSGIGIPGMEAKRYETRKAVFFPFKKILVLNEWEKAFDNSLKPEVNTT